MDSAFILEVENLAIKIDDVELINDVSFKLESGKTMALVGESGCGKSLTALSILQLLPEAAHISEGSICLNKRELSKLSEREMRSVRGNEISMIFQEPASTLDPLMTVGKQITEAIRAHAQVTFQDATTAACNMMDKVGIPDPATRFKQYPFELSGGMCQRIMIAIALICEPLVLIADEPTTALDVTIQAQTLELMHSLQKETGTAILLITHDMGVVADMADMVMVMYAGQVVEYGDVFEIFRQPRHPYTRLLLNSIPHIEKSRKKKLKVIEGIVPDLHHWPSGCRFNPRCPLADERCTKIEPHLETLNQTDHFVSCWNHTLEIKTSYDES